MTTPPTTPAASEGPYSKRDTGRKTHGINWFDLVGPGITPGEHEGDSLTLNERVKYANLGHSSALASLRFTGRPWKTADGVYVARPDDIVYVYEATDGYSRWSGKIIPIKFSTWLDKSDPDWQGHPSTHLKRQCPDGAWNCYSTPEAAEGARLRAALAPFAKEKP